jgi:hypothetical protein
VSEISPGSGLWFVVGLRDFTPKSGGRFGYAVDNPRIICGIRESEAVSGCGYVDYTAPDLSRLQLILLFTFAALLIHQFEEYGGHGGGPRIMNHSAKRSARPARHALILLYFSCL